MKNDNLKRWRKRLMVPTMIFGIGLLLALATVYVGAIAGGLDPAFGTGGKVFTHLTNGDDAGNAVALQTDGKIVVAGFSNEVDFAVVRYNVNGSLDTTFDGDGIVVTDFAGQTDRGHAIAIQSDGKIVVAGETSFTGGSDIAIARYNTDGSLDTSFDTDGKVTTSISGPDSAHAVAIQSDGKIVVAGYAFPGTAELDFAVVRYETNGALDSTFGTGGKFTTDIVGTDSGNAVGIQGDGKIVVVGFSSFDPFTLFSLIRLNGNGTLDATFGNGGKVTTMVNQGYDFANSMAIQSDGKILAAGGSGLPTSLTVVRYNSSGSPDLSFGVNGVATTSVGGYATAIALQADGKVVAGGKGSNGGNSEFVVARFNTNGSLNDKAITPIGSLADEGYGVAIQSDGRIVVAGSSEVAGVGEEFSVARYDLIRLHSSPRRFDFSGNGTSDFAVIRPSTGYWYLQSGNINELQYNLPGDIMVPADYNGDGKTDIANFRNGDWRIFNGGPDVHYGQAGDIPVPGDYDGDTKADRAVFRSGAWYINQSRDGEIGFGFGISTDKPVPEDYDGDGRYDPAVYRDGVWYILNSTTGFSVVQFGLSTDRPVPADYDGDDKADVAVYRNGTWYILGSTSGFRAIQFGISTDYPVPGDYDGDAKADIAVFRDGYWYMLRSSDGAFFYLLFGTTGDIPLESVYVR